MDWVAGRIPVLECIRAKRRRVQVLYLLRDGKGLEDLRDLARQNGIPIKEMSRTELDHLVEGQTHQGVCARTEPFPLPSVEAWARTERTGEVMVVALDGVEDPHNFGAIIRSAAAFGAAAVVFGKDRSAPISVASAKSAAGAMEHIDLVQATNLVRALETLKEAGFWIAGLDADAPQCLWEADLRGKIVLVIGSEGKGIRRLVREHCDFLLRIPLSGAITSLNASVSAAVALAECVRQRAAGSGKAPQSESTS